MKRWPLFLCISVLLIACNKHQLKVTDLKFGDIEKEQIVKNEVDTVFILAGNSPNWGGPDTLGYQTYDAAGHLLVKEELTDHGYSALCQYDSIGLLKHKNYATNNLAQYDLAYKYDPNGLTLQQFWKGKTNDSSLYKFDKNGNLVEAIDSPDADSGREFHYRTKYLYNGSGLLIEKKRQLLVTASQLKELEKQLGVAICNQDTTIYYYVGNLPDNEVSTFYYPTHPERNYSTKTYYNNKGLKDITVSMGNVVERYAYSMRQMND